VSEKGTFQDPETVPSKEVKKDSSPQDAVRKLGQTAIKGTQKK
jgi:hypothetical protein